MLSLQQLELLGGSVAVLVARLLGWLLGGLVGWSEVHAAAEPHQAVGGGAAIRRGLRGRGSCCQCTVTSAASCAGVFTSCCSAVSLPRRSSPRPPPCGSRVWGSESCGCSGSRPLWPEPSQDPPVCSGNWSHPAQRRVEAEVGVGVGGRKHS